MSVDVDSLGRVTQTSISQFFTPVTAEEARTANLMSRSRNSDNVSQSDSSQALGANSRFGTRSRDNRGNLKIFQLNTAKKSESGSAFLDS